jgi:8-oxo-dGTP diphosphatase
MNDYTASPVDWNLWQGEILATLMFIIHDGKVLLIEKKRGIGAGKVNGPGGKIDPGESPEQCAVRETMEELEVRALDPRKRGELCFAMSDMPDIHCHVFVSESHSGTATETEEAVPLWTPLNAIPYHRMWADDIYWLPQMLKGHSFRGRFVFEGEKILWQEVIFDGGVS